MPPLIHTALVQEVISSRYCQAREESKNAYLIFRPCRWQKPVTIVIQACDGCILSYTKPSSSTSCHEFTNLSFRVPVICPESAVSATLNLKFNPGFHIVSRVALNIGVSKMVYPVYRNILALLLIGPFAYFLEKKERPPLRFSLLVQFFLLALIGITANQGFYLLGLTYASPTFASAVQNSVPAITFIMACTLRIEHINLVRRHGVAKVLGTIVSIGGATTITLYRGFPLLRRSLTAQETHHSHDEIESINKSQNWTLGCLHLMGHCLSWAAWMVLQAPVLKKYPAKLTLTSFTCFFGLIQFLVIALFVETDPNNWIIGSWEELFTILYAGIVASGLVVYLQTWCIYKGGPVFVAVFQPLQTLLVAAMAFVVLGDQLYSGSIVGSVFIMLGLYLVLWGKTEEKRQLNEASSQEEDHESLTKNLLGDETKEAQDSESPV